MAHGRRRLSMYGRQVLVERIVHRGWSVTAAAEALQVSRQTAYRWLRRYRRDGVVGLVDRPPIARCRPHALPGPVVQRLLQARRRYGWGPHRLAWLLGVPRLAGLDRPTRRPVRYQRAHPGELVRLDVKKLARIPQGGGHRLRGRATAPRGRGTGFDFVHVAVDDCSRVAFVQAYPDERGSTTAHFLAQAHAFFQHQGVALQAVMTIAPSPTRRPAPSARPWPPWASAISSRAPIGPRPTAKPSASSKP